MKYQMITPPPQLARYVRCFWIYEGEASKTNPYVYRALASGCTELVFHYRGVYDQLINGQIKNSFPAAICAQTRKYSRFIIDQDWGIFGCYLFPFVLPRLFSLPASDFTDNMTDFASVLGHDGKELEEKILCAGSNRHRVDILSRFLQKRIDQEKREEPLVFTSIGQIINSRGLIDVHSLASDYFLSNRQFERKFKEFSGFRPKLFARITRFQAALNEYGSGKSLTDIAYCCGYYDQSHFINDFKEFSGYNPRVYFSGKAEGSEYLEL